MPSVQLAFGHLIQCNINEIIQRTTTCLLLTSVAPGGHGKSMVPVPHGTAWYRRCLFISNINIWYWKFKPSILDTHIRSYTKKNRISRELWNEQRSPFNDHSGIRITWGKTTSRTMDLFASAAMARGYTIYADNPHLRPCEDLSRYVPESVGSVGAVRAAPGD